MRVAAVVEAQMLADPGSGDRDAGIGAQVDRFVFDGPLQTLDEDPPRTFAIHADLAGGRYLDEVSRGEPL